jgi:two-component system sensor histidine kinase KdpD
MRTGQVVQGLLKLGVGDSQQPLSPAQVRLLQAYSTLAALALERASLASVANQVELLQATEKLQSSLLNSISHELRTPLASIFGVLSSLRAERTGGAALDEAVKAELVETAWDEAGNLNRLVSNLLEMTRLQAGALKVRPEPSEMQDVVGATLSRLGDRLDGRGVRVGVREDLPLVSLDFVLVVHVLSNLLDNALKYSPEGSEIEISAHQVNGEARILVADRGVGIPPGELEAVFESFYRVARRKAPGGTGLGLSICRGIIQAHGGRVWAERRPGGGTIVTVALPLDGQAAAAEVASPSPAEGGTRRSDGSVVGLHE